MFVMLRRGDASYFLLVNVFDVLQSVEKALIQKIPNYAEWNINLKRYTAIYNFILTVITQIVVINGVCLKTA